MKSVLQTNFINGEVGDRLNGSLTEIYSRAVKECENFILSDIGSLRVLNRLDKTTITNLTDLNFFSDTRDTFCYLVTSNNKIGFMNKADKSIYLETAPISNINRVNTFYFNGKQNFIVSNGTTCKIKEVDKVNNNLKDSDFLSQIKYPVQIRTPLKVSFYRWGLVSEYNYVTNAYEDKKQLFKIAEFTDLNNVGTKSNYTIDIKGIIVKRCYFLSSANLSREVFTLSEFSNNDCIVNFEQGLPTDLYINGQNVTFTNVQTDGSGNQWATTLSIANITYGQATLGTRVLLNETNVRDIVEYQNRLVILTDDYIYFSEKLNYTNFLNGVNETDAFWIRPTPIKNTQPLLKRMVASKGLFINSDMGIIVLGFNSNLSVIDNYIDIVSDIKPMLDMTISNDIVYFTDKKGVLYASWNTGSDIVNFVTTSVDKYDIDRKIYSLDTIVIEGIEYIMCRDANINDKIYLYRLIGEGMYSRVSIKTADMKYTSKVFKHDEGLENGFLITDNTGKTDFYNLGDNFTQTSTVKILPPLFQTKDFGLYKINRVFSVKEVVVKVLNQKNYDIDGKISTQGIKSMTINGEKLDRITDDEYDVFMYRSSFNFGKGFEIEIEHYQNTKKVEILGIEVFYD